MMMAAILAVVLVYLRMAGTGAFMGDEDEGRPPRKPGPTSPRALAGWRNALLIFAGLAVVYMLVPIIVIALFSFDTTSQGKLDFDLERLHPRVLEGRVRGRGRQRLDDHEPPAGRAVDDRLDDRSGR